MVIELRAWANQQGLPIPVFWFSELDLDFHISDPAIVGKDLEDFISRLPAEADGYNIIEALATCHTRLPFCEE
jgi:hypothetical protein